MFSHQRTDAGFTLIELLIVMLVFVIIMMITAKAFETILTKSNVVTRSEESNIEGLVGLEIMRHDLQQAGVGLFTDIQDTQTGINYLEVRNTLAASAYNDAGRVPRAAVTANDLPVVNIFGSTADYLVIKATTVGNSNTAQKFAYATDNDTTVQWDRRPFNIANETAIAMNLSGSKKILNNAYSSQAFPNFAVTYSLGTNKFSNWAGDGNLFDAPVSGEVRYYYGIHTNTRLSAPFNRVDYYISRPLLNIPTSCSPDTGILYKSVMNHDPTGVLGGTQTEIPLLDCAADMQIVLGWNHDDPDNSVAIDSWSSASGGGLTTASGRATPAEIDSYMQDPAEIRRRLRIIKVYILAQDGGFDRNFQNPPGSSIVVGDADLGETNLTKTVLIDTANKRNYRWKLYRIVVRPKSL